MKRKIGMVSLGCPKNLVDSEIMLAHLAKENYEIVTDEMEADIIIVNTCGFINSAREESVNTILEMGKLKEGKLKLLIVTGCLAEKYRHEILAEMPEVDAVVGTGSYGEIAEIIRNAENGVKVERYGKLEDTDYLNSERIVSTGKATAYLKIAEGCDNCCTYCTIPSLRGRFRSRKMEDILREANVLVSGGAKEIILIAQDTTRYGLDLYNEKMLVPLLREMSKIDGLEWIRLLYLYPEELHRDMLNEIIRNEKVLRYFDIPIQHASPKILKMMGRRGSLWDIDMLLDAIRDKMPDAVLRTSLIVGFPGEDEEDFAKLERFVETYKFDRLGVFMYSKEEGTPAAKLKGQVPSKIKKQRYDRIMRLQQEISKNANAARVGKRYRVLCEGVAEDGIFYYGRSYAESPDTDGLIYFTSVEEIKTGDFVEVEILDFDEYDLIGEAKHEPAK